MSTASAPATADNAIRRRTVTKLVLAAIAVLGIGAAVTVAAWTDDAWFTAEASTGEVELSGSIDGETFVPADEEGTLVIALDAEENLANLVPNETRSVPLWIRNDSTVDLEITLADFATDGALFDDEDVVVSILDDPLGETLEPDEVHEFALQVVTPDWEGEDGQNLLGSIVVQVTGSTT